MKIGLFDFFRRKKNADNDSIKTMENKIQNTNVMTEQDREVNLTYLKKLDNGLLPGEVILLDWIKGKTMDATFPGYFEYTYGIEAKRSALDLLENGYVEYSSPLESLPSLKVDKLKEILKTKSLKISGPKQELIVRIIDNFTSDEISHYINAASLKLTSKGEEVFKKYYYVVPAHKNDSKDGIYTVATAINHVKKLDYKPNNGEISWVLFQQSYSEYSQKFKYGLLNNVIRNMARQLEKEKRYNEALHHYLRVFILDLSGLNNGLYLSAPKHIFINNFTTSKKITSLLSLLNIDTSVYRRYGCVLR